MRILLTAEARAFAVENGWLDYLETLDLDAGVQLDDRIGFGEDHAHDFKVVRRRIALTAEEPILDVTLDYPAR